MTAGSKGKVGIFWFVDGKILYDAWLLNRAESYGGCLGYAGGHEVVWENWKRHRRVPAELDYDNPPRGRVSFDTVRDRFLLLADPCILKDEIVVGTLMQVFDLPPHRTERLLDSHYRCRECLRSPTQ